MEDRYTLDTIPEDPKTHEKRYYYLGSGVYFLSKTLGLRGERH